MRVLVVDDDRDIRELVRLALTDVTVEVRVADGTAAALEHVGWADVLVTDLMMPELDGAELIGRARQARPDLPVVVLTAAGSDARHVRDDWSLPDDVTIVCKLELNTQRFRRAVQGAT